MYVSVIKCGWCGAEREGQDGIFPLCVCGQGGQPSGTQWADWCPQTANTSRVEWETTDLYVWRDSSKGADPTNEDRVHIISGIVWGEERASGVVDWDYRMYCGDGSAGFFFAQRPPRLRQLCANCVSAYQEWHRYDPVNPRIFEAPKGMTRVLRVNQILGLYFLEEDSDNREQTIATVNRRNAERTLSTEDVFRAYDDHKNCVAGQDVV